MKSLLLALSIGVLVVAPVSADLTLVQTVSGKGMGMGGGQPLETTMYIKGSRMRTEGLDRITIIDVAKHQMTVLDPNKKEARIVDMARVQEGMQKSLAGAPRAQLNATGQTKTILGRTCTEYAATVSVPMKMGNDEMNVLMTGPIWIAKGAPGTADFTGFYKAAADNGMFFSNPDQAKGAGAAQVRGMTEMYRQISELGGVTYSSAMQTKFDGSGMMAAMMNKVGGFVLDSTVKSASTDAIPDSMFEVPAGYTTKTK